MRKTSIKTATRLANRVDSVRSATSGDGDKSQPNLRPWVRMGTLPTLRNRLPPFDVGPPSGRVDSRIVVYSERCGKIRSDHFVRHTEATVRSGRHPGRFRYAGYPVCANSSRKWRGN